MFLTFSEYGWGHCKKTVRERWFGIWMRAPMQQRKKRARQRCSGHSVRQRCNAAKQQWGSAAFEAGWGHRWNTAKNERGSDVSKNGWGQRCNTAKNEPGNDASHAVCACEKIRRKFCSGRTIRLPYATQRTTEPGDAANKNSKFWNFKFQKFKFQKNVEILKFEVNKKNNREKICEAQRRWVRAGGCHKKNLKIWNFEVWKNLKLKKNWFSEKIWNFENFNFGKNLKFEKIWNSKKIWNLKKNLKKNWNRTKIGGAGQLSCKTGEIT